MFKLFDPVWECVFYLDLSCKFSKGPVTGYGKLTWEFAHAWNCMKLCTLIVLVMTAIIMVYSLVNSIPLANYDVIYDVTMIAKGTPL